MNKTALENLYGDIELLKLYVSIQEDEKADERFNIIVGRASALLDLEIISENAFSLIRDYINSLVEGEGE